MSLYGNSFYIEQTGFDVKAFINGIEIERILNVTYQGITGEVPLVTLQFYPSMFELNTKKKFTDNENEMYGKEDLVDQNTEID